MNHVREEDRGGNLSTMIRLLKYFPTAFIKRLKNYAIHVHACAALFCNFIALLVLHCFTPYIIHINRERAFFLMASMSRSFTPSKI